MATFYKAHKGDYYCRELPYRIFKGCGSRFGFWRVKRLINDASIYSDSYGDNIEFYAESLKEAKEYVNQRQDDKHIIRALFNETE